MKEYKGHKVFNPIYLIYLEGPWRDSWQLPGEVIKALRLREGMTIADIGAGGGYFAEKFSKRVGPTGRVYATDVQEVMLRRLRARAKNHKLRNVTVLRSTFEDSGVPKGSCDIAFFSSVYKELTNRVTYMKNLGLILKEKGRVAIIEYRLETLDPGPEVQYRISESQVIEEMEAAGYRLLEKFDFLPREYFLVFGLDKHCQLPPPGDQEGWASLSGR